MQVYLFVSSSAFASCACRYQTPQSVFSLKVRFFFFFLVSGYEIPLFFPVITCALPLGVLIGFDYYYYYYYYFCLYLFWVLFWLNFCYYANFFFLAFKNINNIIEGAKFNFIETNC